MDRILGTLVYARQNLSSDEDRRVLMLHRNKEPNKGLAVPLLPIPQADAIFFPHIISDDESLYQARYAYDADLNLVHAEEFVFDGAGDVV